MNLAESIKYIRQSLDMSQRELAQELGCSQTAVSSFEKGTKNPSYDMLKNISDFAKKRKIKVNLL